MLITVDIPHQGCDLNRLVSTLPLVFEFSSYLRNYLCPWVMQIKLFFLKLHSSHFTNTVYWRAETLPNQRAMFHSFPPKDLTVFRFSFFSYGDEYTVHNSPVMTLIKYHLQTWCKGFTKILILDTVCINQLPKYHASWTWI